MRKRQCIRVSRQRGVQVLAAAAIAAIAPATTTVAGVTNDGGAPLTDSRLYQVSAYGATALGQLTRGAQTNSNNLPTGEQNGLWRLGVEPLRIGRSTYTFNPGAAQLIGYRDQATAPANLLTADRIVYQYGEVGSVNGVLGTVKSGGLFLPTGFGNELNVDTPSQSAPLWRMGWSQVNATTYVIDGNGTTATTAGGYLPAYAQPKVRIGYTDVRSFQAFAADDLPGTPSPDRRPRNVASTPQVDNAQYGVGRKAFNPATGDNGTNYQALANRSVIAGESGGDPTTSFIRNETLAVVPFAVVANPGTGLSRLEEDDVRWLNGAGRLPNGANFNSTTREIGSGTRNQGTNNFNIDASWGGGERDRRSLRDTNLADVDVNNQPVTIRPGDEMNPNKDLFGVDASLAASEQAKEHRVGPLMRFSDKSSGGSGVRPTVVNNRMAIGPNLSVGDVGDRGRRNLNGTIPGAANTDPLRVVSIRFQKQGAESDTGTADDGFNQPTAYNITNGRHQHWSAAQAVTVIGIDTNGDGRPDRRGTVAEDASNPNKLIWNDIDDQTQNPDGTPLASPVGPVGVGIHRKFLNNIRQSVTNYPNNAITPADAVIDAGFVPEQVMKVDKEFDGGVQTFNNSPASFNQALYDLLVTNDPPLGAQNLKSRLNWIDPSTDLINSGSLGFVGRIGAGGVNYRIFARDIPTIGTGSNVPTKQIPISFRTVLAGDMDGNGVRDHLDTADLARAFAASEALGDIAGTAAVTGVSAGLSSDELIVLTDFDGSGNISGTNAAPTFRAVERDDVLFFLKGATVDTVNANPLTGYSGSTNIQTRREDGVRLGKLVKNGAIDTFNATLQSLVGTPRPFGGGNWTQAQIDLLKVFKGDVNRDGSLNRTDARNVNDLVGTAPYSLTLEQVLVNYDVDPIYSELTDDNFIGHVDPDGAGPLLSDFQVIRAELATTLLDGDANFDGTTSIADFSTLAARFNTPATRWSEADFNFDGVTGIGDFSLLAANFNQVAPTGVAGRPGAVPEPAALSLLAIGAVGLLRRSRR